MPSQRRFLIAGASGLVGTALSRKLREDGHDVVTLVRRPSRGDQELTWDPSQGQLEGGLDARGPIDVVVNLSGAGIADRRWSAARKREILESRRSATRTLVKAMDEASQRPTAFLSSSAIGFYGDRGNDQLKEADEPGTGFLAEVCQAWEAEALAAADLGIRTVLLRTGIVLDREGGALAKQLPIFKAGLGGRLASGAQWTSWISLEDEVGAIAFLAAHDEVSGPVNLTAPAPVTNAAFTKALGSALHRPAVAVVPRLALAAALGGELVDEMLLASARVLPSVLLDAGYAFTSPELNAALASLLR